MKAVLVEGDVPAGKRAPQKRMQAYRIIDTDDSVVATVVAQARKPFNTFTVGSEIAGMVLLNQAVHAPAHSDRASELKERADSIANGLKSRGINVRNLPKFS